MLNRNALRRLAHVLPATKEGVTGAVVEFLVEQTMMELGGKRSIDEISAGLGRIFLLKFSKSEIHSALVQLLDRGNVRESQNRYSLTGKRTKKLNGDNQAVRQLELRVFADWHDYIGQKYADLTDADKSLLVQDLQVYLNYIFCRHGAECAFLLCPGSREMRELVDRYSEEKINKILPERKNHLMTVRKMEFPLFLSEVTPGKRDYFSGMLDGTFIYNLVQIDPDTKKYLQKNFGNYTFYLDTNILYSLFNLSDPRGRNIVESVFKKAEEFNIKMVVSENTISEMRKSIKVRGEALTASPPVKRELAAAGADLVSEDSFIAAYWRQFHDTGISKKDFIYKFSHIEELLRSHNIGIHYDLPEFAEELLDIEREKLQESIGASKNDSVAEHDSFHRILIRHLREEARRERTEARYWFLTFDTQLRPYSMITREEDEPPFIIFPHQLFQLLRPFTERTKDFDKTFVELFSRPHIKSSRGVLPNNIAETVLSTISGYKDLPTNIAIDIIMDANFQEMVLSEEDEELRREKITERIDKEVADKMRRLEEKVMELEARHDQKQRILDSKDKDYQGELVHREKKISEKQDELIRKNFELMQSAERLKEMERELALRKKRLLNKKKQLIRLKTALFALSFLILVLLNTILFIYVWPLVGPVMKGAWVAMDVLLLILIMKIRWHLSVSIQMVLGVLAFVQFVPWLLGLSPDNSAARVDNFEECEQKGYEVTKTQPRTCTTPEGKTFVDDY